MVNVKDCKSFNNGSNPFLAFNLKKIEWDSNPR